MLRAGLDTAAQVSARERPKLPLRRYQRLGAVSDPRLNHWAVRVHPRSRSRPFANWQGMRLARRVHAFTIDGAKRASTALCAGGHLDNQDASAERPRHQGLTW
jgi:hypothetical protein